MLMNQQTEETNQDTKDISPCVLKKAFKAGLEHPGDPINKH